MRSKIKLRPLLVISMIVAGLVPMGIATLVISRLGSNSLEDATYDKLDTEVQIRRNYLDNYLSTVGTQNRVLAADKSTVDALKNFKKGYAKLPANLGVDASEMQGIRSKEFGYSDIYLVDAESGAVVYSVSKHAEFGTDLIKGAASRLRPCANSSTGTCSTQRSDGCAGLRALSPIIR